MTAETLGGSEYREGGTRTFEQITQQIMMSHRNVGQKNETAAKSAVDAGTTVGATQFGDPHPTVGRSIGKLDYGLKKKLIKRIGSWSYYTCESETRFLLMCREMKEFRKEWKLRTLRKYGSMKSYRQALAERNGFHSYTEYINAWARNRGFKSLYHLEKFLAQQQGYGNQRQRGFSKKYDRFVSEDEYQCMLAKKAGFKSRGDRENFNAVRAGFASASERRKARLKQLGFSGFTDYKLHLAVRAGFSSREEYEKHRARLNKDKIMQRKLRWFYSLVDGFYRDEEKAIRIKSPRISLSDALAGSSEGCKGVEG